MNTYNPDRSRGRSRWGLLLLAVCGLLVLTQCDSGIDPYVEPPPSETDLPPRVEAVQEWYKTALAEEQSAPVKLPEGAAGKIAEEHTGCDPRCDGARVSAGLGSDGDLG